MTIQIPDEIARQYGVFASAAGLDLDTYISQALLAKLDDFEDVMARLKERAHDL